MEAKHLLQRVADGAERCGSASVTGSIDQDACTSFVTSLQDYMQARLSATHALTTCATERFAQSCRTSPAVLQTGLKGNRAVDPDLLSVVSAMTRAYPLLLGPSWTHATCAQEGLPGSADAVLWSWLAQARYTNFNAVTTRNFACCIAGCCSDGLYVCRPAQMAAW